jgi:succinate-semialdehyde dehydrogenase/glutarate-semialdehyde dehydrogenase
VSEKIYDKFVDAFISVFENLVIGPGSDPKTDVGPLINQKRLDFALELVADAQSKGAQLRTGGKRLTQGALSKGFFFSPAVLTNVPSQAKILLQEPFCPAAPIVAYSDPQQALDLANSLPYALASYVFTNSIKLAHFYTMGLKAGMVGLNQPGVSQAETPFGGLGDSGWGREGGLEGIEPFLFTKSISKSYQ